MEGEMSRLIFVNLPVTDLARSTAFYYSEMLHTAVTATATG